MARVRAARIGVVALAGVLLLAGVARAQDAAIAGVAKDATGLCSRGDRDRCQPALIEQQRTAVPTPKDATSSPSCGRVCTR